jgi:hypothetical protein
VRRPNACEKLLADRCMRGKRNEIINSINLCRKKRELSKIKVNRLQKPAGRPPESKPPKASTRAVQPQVEKHAGRAPGKVALTNEQRFQCLPSRKEDLRSHRTKRFVSAPTSSPSAAADLRCQATQNRIGLRRSDSCSPKQARVERTAFNHGFPGGVWIIKICKRRFLYPC